MILDGVEVGVDTISSKFDSIVRVSVKHTTLPQPTVGQGHARRPGREQLCIYNPEWFLVILSGDFNFKKREV